MLIDLFKMQNSQQSTGLKNFSDPPNYGLSSPDTNPEIPESNKYKMLALSCATWLAHGCSIIGTAKQHGIGSLTLGRWAQTEHFKILIEQQKEIRRMELLERIKDAGQKPHLWAANAWILERDRKTFGDDYVQHSKARIDGNISVNFSISLADDDVIPAEITEEVKQIEAIEDQSGGIIGGISEDD